MKRQHTINNTIGFNTLSCLSIIIIITSFYSCKKYLDIKPDKKLQIPSTIQDCQALLADYGAMNGGYPYQGEVSADNYYLTFENWNTLEVIDRDAYIWKSDANVNFGTWSGSYQRILNANQVLETLSNITPANQDKTTWNTLKGTALFFRAFNFFHIAQIWAGPYNITTAGQDLGIPLRLTPDISEKTIRYTVQQTYDQIIRDLKEAKELLPATQPLNITHKTTLLTKAAALAALARVYLSMSDYTNAATNANDCLQQYHELIDYSQLDPALGNPISQFNKEVIFDAQSSFNFPLFYAKVDTSLYASYQTNDLRKSLFFSDNGDGSYAFRGGYTGTPSYLIFNGLATDEIYLVRAECFARAGNKDAAMSDLNTLLRSRWDAGFIPFTAANANDALAQILAERRKEMLFRGTRWTDLRRLNKDTHFETTLMRNLNGTEYTLPPNDLRYVLLIPTEVLSRVNIPQNPR